MRAATKSILLGSFISFVTFFGLAGFAAVLFMALHVFAETGDLSFSVAGILGAMAFIFILFKLSQLEAGWLRLAAVERRIVS